MRIRFIYSSEKAAFDVGRRLTGEIPIAGLVDFLLQQGKIDLALSEKARLPLPVRGADLLCIRHRLADRFADMRLTHGAGHPLDLDDSSVHDLLLIRKLVFANPQYSTSPGKWKGGNRAAQRPDTMPLSA